MPERRTQFCARVSIPNPGRTIMRGCEDTSAIGAVAQRSDVSLRMHDCVGQEFAGTPVPDPRDLVPTHRRYLPSIGAKANKGNPILMRQFGDHRPAEPNDPNEGGVGF